MRAVSAFPKGYHGVPSRAARLKPLGRCPRRIRVLPIYLKLPVRHLHMIVCRVFHDSCKKNFRHAMTVVGKTVEGGCLSHHVEVAVFDDAHYLFVEGDSDSCSTHQHAKVIQIAMKSL